MGAEKTVYQVIEEHEKEFKTFLGYFINTLYEDKVLCKQCYEKVLSRWKEVLTHKQTIYRR